MTIICCRSSSSSATVLLFGIASMASAAPDAPDTEGPISQAATETAATANAATPAAGRMTPLRRTNRVVRRVLGAPVRCRDKAILSSAKRAGRVCRTHQPLHRRHWRHWQRFSGHAPYAPGPPRITNDAHTLAMPGLAVRDNHRRRPRLPEKGGGSATDSPRLTRRVDRACCDFDHVLLRVLLVRRIAIFRPEPGRIAAPAGRPGGCWSAIPARGTKLPGSRYRCRAAASPGTVPFRSVPGEWSAGRAHRGMSRTSAGIEPGDADG